MGGVVAGAWEVTTAWHVVVRTQLPGPAYSWQPRCRTAAGQGTPLLTAPAQLVLAAECAVLVGTAQVPAGQGGG